MIGTTDIVMPPTRVITKDFIVIFHSEGHAKIPLFIIHPVSVAMLYQMCISIGLRRQHCFQHDLE
jgi:hypothetical protein